MSVKVSVIIPVYNAVSYLQRCVDSLLGQTLSDCEYIFVNDGSKDGSRQQLEAYAKLDSRVKVVNQENSGVSVARNRGLMLATGEYIGFVDADDYIELDMLERLYEAAGSNHCDVVVSNYESELEGRKSIISFPFPVGTVLTKKDIERFILPYFLKYDNLNSVWNKLYRSEVIHSKQIEFPAGVALGEDELFNMLFFSYADSMVYIEYAGYHYQEIAGSATRSTFNTDYFAKSLEMFHAELPKAYTKSLNLNTVTQLKSIKFINHLVAYIHLYFSPSGQVSFLQKYSYVKRMVANASVRETLPLYIRENYSELGRYEKFIIHMIKRRFILGLYCATIYSRFKNTV
jgi:glycosyltransferase involved in cell wall biosynthesis